MLRRLMTAGALLLVGCASERVPTGVSSPIGPVYLDAGAHGFDSVAREVNRIRQALRNECDSVLRGKKPPIVWQVRYCRRILGWQQWRSLQAEFLARRE